MRFTKLVFIMTIAMSGTPFVHANDNAIASRLDSRIQTKANRAISSRIGQSEKLTVVREDLLQDDEKVKTGASTKRRSRAPEQAGAVQRNQAEQRRRKKTRAVVASQ